MMNRHILFVHIPKTAGTSFRIAAHEYFGDKNTFYDYSSHSMETSELIMKNMYHNNDPYSVYKSLLKYDKSFLSGHYPVAKYAPIYDALNIVSFIREPVSQVISHYNHYKNYNHYEKELKDFIKEPRFRNLQSRLLKHIKYSLCGFIGLTEEYNTSIDIFNDIYGTDLKHKYMNVKKDGSLSIRDIDKSLLDEIVRLNEEDIDFYNAVKRQFFVRKELHSKQLPYTYGFIQKNTKNQLAGIAFQQDTDEAIAIDIYRNDTFLETIYANKLRLINKNFPRKNFIGFHYINNKDITKGKLRAIVRDTGQTIL